MEGREKGVEKVTMGDMIYETLKDDFNKVFTNEIEFQKEIQMETR